MRHSWRIGKIAGIDIHIDRPKGFVMHGVDNKGTPWKRVYKYDYGFIPKTINGDDDGLDVFIGPVTSAREAYWAIQNKPNGKFDEYKVFLGFPNRDAAIGAYKQHIPQNLMSGLVTMKLDMMKSMLGIRPKGLLKAAAFVSLVDELQKIGEELEKMGSGKDDDKGRAPTEEDEKAILSFIKRSPGLKDEDYHAFLESRGVNPHKGEAVAYAALRAELKGGAGDKMKGGLADKKKPSDFDPKQIQMGTKVEFEHVNDKAKAREIAMDHLVEHPQYYTHLKKMEEKLEKKGAIDEDARGVLKKVRKFTREGLRKRIVHAAKEVKRDVL